MRPQKLIFWGTLPLLAGLLTFGLSSPAGRSLLNSFFIPSPAISYPELIEIGEQEIGAIASAPFIIENNGTQDLLIEDIRSSCSCSGIGTEKDGKFTPISSLNIGPAQRADLSVRIAVQGRPGAPLRNTILFRCNDPKRPEPVIQIIVPKVMGGINAIPTSAIFGNVELNSPAHRIIEVFDGGAKSRTIEKITITHPNRFRARLLADVPLQERPESSQALIGRIEVSAITTNPGPLDGEIQVFLANESRRPDRISVVGNVTAPVELCPSVVVLPRRSKEGPVYSAECLCQSSLGKPVHISLEECPPGVHVRFKPLIEASAKQTIYIELDKGAGHDVPKARSHTVRFRVHAGDLHSELRLLVITVNE
jgi:hypothetical protein